MVNPTDLAAKWKKKRRSRPWAVHPSVRRECKKLWLWTLHANFLTKFFHTCHAHRHMKFYHFNPPWLKGDHGCGSQNKRKTRPLGFVFWQTFQLIRMKFNMVLKQFKLNIPILLWVRFNRIESYLIRWYYWTLDFDTSLTDLGLDSRSSECKKANNSTEIISQSFHSI